METAVQLRVNERALVQNLRHAFSDEKTTWIRELLQNARRAGATEIHVSIDQESKRICFLDNGSGIENLQNILTVAESGWPEDIKEQEKPYGIGFLSALFAADKIYISSCGKSVCFRTSDALDFAGIQIEPSPASHRTTIILDGVKHLPDESIFRNLVEGFPVPVFFNGVELERPYAVDSMQFVKSDVGLISLDILSRDVYFLQGFPVYSSYRGKGAVVHLDSSKFTGRLPDRDILVNHIENLEVIDNHVKKVREGILRRRCEVALREENHEFFHKHAPEISSYPSLRPIFNQLSFIPNSLIVGLLVAPALSDVWEKYKFAEIHRSQVETGQVIVFKQQSMIFDVDPEFAPEKFSVLAAAGAMSVLLGMLDSDHWIHEYVVQDITVHEVTPDSPTEGVPACFSWQNTKVFSCSAVNVSTTFLSLRGEQEVNIRSDFAPVVFYDEEHGYVTYVPQNNDGSIVPPMFGYYYDDENPDLPIIELESDRKIIRRILSCLRGEPIQNILRNLLVDEHWQFEYPDLQGKSFRVTYTDDGQLSVDLID